MKSPILAYLGLLILCLTSSALCAQQADGDMDVSWDEALASADLDKVIENSGPFTVFAPSDQALTSFMASRKEILEDPSRKSELRALLSYHIVAGEITAAGILQRLCRGEGVARFTTVQGEELLATLEGTDIVLMDCSGNRARIVQADNHDQNLVFHRIDSVILPTSRP
ncbi:fasciclin domain-containing protein [Robiginitalea sp. M366]|uniref:fasciclin domain-containing protein n=1 Tax=Robiginitalea aestuariiviva TaxID=3036903 RepID=UPI00240D18F6|nr:fasciclin domain-containing protein [Robiginitalea aestuariiviva]MDG1573095.1 fasciclin domain-containing protein [Robiginitalea aestuariiviva]